MYLFSSWWKVRSSHEGIALVLVKRRKGGKPLDVSVRASSLMRQRYIHTAARDAFPHVQRKSYVRVSVEDVGGDRGRPPKNLTPDTCPARLPPFAVLNELANNNPHIWRAMDGQQLKSAIKPFPV